jgi:hypothetical protein
MPLLQFVAITRDPFSKGLSIKRKVELARKCVWGNEAYHTYHELLREEGPGMLTQEVIAVLCEEGIAVFEPRAQRRFRRLIRLMAQVRKRHGLDDEQFGIALSPILEAYKTPELGPLWTLRTLRRCPETLSPTQLLQFGKSPPVLCGAACCHQGRVSDAGPAIASAIGEAAPTPLPDGDCKCCCARCDCCGECCCGKVQAKSPFDLQVELAKAAKQQFFEKPFEHVLDPMGYLERSWNRGKSLRKTDAKKVKKKKGDKEDPAPETFGEFPWISALLLVPLAYYFGSIRAVVNAEIGAFCG